MHQYAKQCTKIISGFSAKLLVLSQEKCRISLIETEHVVSLSEGINKMRKLSTEDLVLFISTNMNDWKQQAISVKDDLISANDELSENDISIITSQEFYDDLHDLHLSLAERLDNHFLSHLDKFSFTVLDSLHNIYNR